MATGQLEFRMDASALAEFRKTIMRVFRGSDQYIMCQWDQKTYGFTTATRIHGKQPPGWIFEQYKLSPVGCVLYPSGKEHYRFGGSVRVFVENELVQHFIQHQQIRGIVLDYVDNSHHWIWNEVSLLEWDVESKNVAPKPKSLWWPLHYTVDAKQCLPLSRVDVDFIIETARFPEHIKIFQHIGLDNFRPLITTEILVRAMGYACENLHTTYLGILRELGATVWHAKANNCYALGKAITSRHETNYCLKMLIRDFGATSADLEEAIQHCQCTGEMKRIRRIQRLYKLRIPPK